MSEQPRERCTTTGGIVTVVDGPYSSVAPGSAIIVLGSLMEDGEGTWLSYPADPDGVAGRSYGAVLTSIVDPDLLRKMSAAGLVAATGLWDGNLMRVTGFDEVDPDWSEPYRNDCHGITPEEGAALVNSTPPELEESINSVEHFHPDGCTRKIRISVTLAAPGWDDWQATVQPWVEVVPLMRVLS